MPKARGTYTQPQLRNLAPKLLELCGPVPPAGHRLRIAMIPVSANNSRFWIIQALLAVTLRARGHDVRFVLCDRAQEACQFLTRHPEARWQRHCQHCWQRFIDDYQGLGFPIDRVSQLDAPGRVDDDTNDDRRDAADWSDADEAHARATLCRQRRTGTAAMADDDDPDLRLFRRTVRQFGRVGRSLVDRGLDIAIMPDGLYATYGKLLDVFRDAGVGTLVHGRGRRRLREGFSWDRPVSDWDLTATWDAIGDLPLTPHQTGQIDAYLESRKSHAGEAFSYTFGEAGDRDHIRERLGIHDDRPLDVMFPNLLWDANVVGRARAFPDQPSWIDATVRHYAARRDRVLCIKAHPAEVVRGAEESAADLAIDALRRIDPAADPTDRSRAGSVVVIRPDEPFHSDSMIRAADRPLVFTGTVGLEAAAMGKTAVIAGRTHYGSKGFTIDPKSPTEYLAALDAEDLPREVTAELARRYFHLWAFGAQVPWPFFDDGPMGHIETISERQLAGFGSHDSVRLVVDAIEHRTPVIAADARRVSAAAAA